ncbi:MAG: hypothetical protein HOJ88_04550 [Proteobacteria bacterium]|mgnify:CR=1 FL=1|jgi:hypothetical protein|nr:hypothetical protein [Pseudomonadota bacterium]
MKIDIRKIPIFVINLEDAVERRDFMSKQLDELGLDYKFVTAVKADPYPIGIAISHLKTIKQRGLEPPFMVLEDDCLISRNNFPYEYDLPNECDALYLGHSIFGLRDKADQYGIRWGTRNNVKYKHYSEKYIRVFNMLARHAIIYVSRKFVANSIEANLSALLDHDFTIPGDIMYAEMQPEHIVLSPPSVSYRQYAELGGAEAVTEESIVDIMNPYDGVDY